MEPGKIPDRDQIWNSVCATVYAYPEFRELSSRRQKLIINEVIDHTENLINIIAKDEGLYPWNRKED